MLTPSDVETERAKRHRAVIERCLMANFSIDRFFRTGSFGNGTSVSGYSDVDYFAVIPKERLRKNSRLTLASVSAALRRRFSSSGVRISSPAVVLPFGTNRAEWTEVVPAVWVDDHKGFSVYGIADGTGGWLHSCPEIHNAYVAELDRRCGTRARAMVRFVKAAKYSRDIRISSFYLELTVAAFARLYSTGAYSKDMLRCFQVLAEAELPATPDPMGISGAVEASTTAQLHAQAVRKFAKLGRIAAKAVEFEEAGREPDAFRLWRAALGRFPVFRRRK